MTVSEVCKRNWLLLRLDHTKVSHERIVFFFSLLLLFLQFLLLFLNKLFDGIHLLARQVVDWTRYRNMLISFLFYSFKETPCSDSAESVHRTFNFIFHVPETVSLV